MPRSILNKEGSLLASSGEDMNSSQVVAAIAANIWSAYDKVHHSLEVMLFDCQVITLVAVCFASYFILCIFCGFYNLWSLTINNNRKET